MRDAGRRAPASGLKQRPRNTRRQMASPQWNARVSLRRRPRARQLRVAFTTGDQFSQRICSCAFAADISRCVFGSPPEGKSDGRSALLHLSLQQVRFLRCYGRKKRPTAGRYAVPNQLAVLDADHSSSSGGWLERFYLRSGYRRDQGQGLLAVHGLTQTLGKTRSDRPWGRTV
jgi:hypothetical protein